MSRHFPVRVIARRIQLVVIAAAAAGALSACGSTVPLGAGAGSGQLASGDDGLGLGVEQTQTPGSAGAGGGDDTLTAGGPRESADPSPDGATGTDNGTPTAAPTTTANGFPLSGRGFTASTLNVGFGVSSDDSAAVLSAFGVAGLEDLGDPKAQFNAVLKDINAHGGIAGRKVVAVFHGYDTTEIINNPSGAAQKACADMNEDHKIVAMLGPGVTNDTAKSCFTKAGIPMLVPAGLENPPAFRASTYNRYPGYIGIGGMNGDRFFGTAVERMHGSGFFEKWNTGSGKPGGTQPVKIGALVLDNASGTETLATYNRALAKFGMKVSEVTRLPEDVSSAIAVGTSAVLRYRSAGITHVLGITIPFASTAQQQGYHPRYFVNVAFQVVAQSSSEKQLNGAMTFGYQPMFDTDVQHYPGDPNANTTKCVNVMKASGQPPTNNQMKLSMVTTCDMLYTLKAAVDSTGGDLSTAGIIRGYESLGTKAPIGSTWVNEFGPGEHASARALRDMVYNAGCKCFFYADKVNRIATS